MQFRAFFSVATMAKSRYSFPNAAIDLPWYVKRHNLGYFARQPSPYNLRICVWMRLGMGAVLVWYCGRVIVRASTLTPSFSTWLICDLISFAWRWRPYFSRFVSIINSLAGHGDCLVRNKTQLHPPPPTTKHTLTCTKKSWKTRRTIPNWKTRNTRSNIKIYSITLLPQHPENKHRKRYLLRGSSNANYWKT